MSILRTLQFYFIPYYNAVHVVSMSKNKKISAESNIAKNRYALDTKKR